MNDSGTERVNLEWWHPIVWRMKFAHQSATVSPAGLLDILVVRRPVLGF